MKKKNIYLLIFILIASFGLIVINYYTIKILSAARSYINGESEYSKGQKDAMLHLYTFIESEDTAYINLFDQAISIPMGDNLARKSLLEHGDDKMTGNYFLMGRNHPGDIPEMIWLFKTFKSTLMKRPIQLWTDAEPLINELYRIGNDIKVKVSTGSLTKQEKLLAVKQVSFLSAELYKKESEFSKVLGDTARKVNKYLLWANIFCILFMIGNIALYATKMILRLGASNQALKAKNREIIETNKELDTLVYSVSHDLRSPITSIKGLVEISKTEADPQTVKEYIGLIESTINKQDMFILEIIDFYRNKRSSLSYDEFSLKNLIEDVVANNKFSPLARHVTISREISLDSVRTDQLRVKMIINNLVSNAIKYSDESKPVKNISIKTGQQQNNMVIEIEDNGVGIDQKYLSQIFDMFFVTANNNKGTGLGLYILKQNVEKLKGRVDVISRLNEGTKFTVQIPLVG